MIKFTLIIWVCSFLGHQSVCMPPLEFPRTFDSWYDCSKGAHRESVLLMNKMGYKYINENKIAIKYACIEGHTT
jgi:hypothetical protein